MKLQQQKTSGFIIDCYVVQTNLFQKYSFVHCLQRLCSSVVISEFHKSIRIIGSLQSEYTTITRIRRFNLLWRCDILAFLIFKEISNQQKFINLQHTKLKSPKMRQRQIQLHIWHSPVSFQLTTHLSLLTPLTIMLSTLSPPVLRKSESRLWVTPSGTYLFMEWYSLKAIWV